MSDRPSIAPPTLDPGEGLTERYVALRDGRRLRTVVAGEGTGPLVVFEAGMSAPAAEWVHTQREVSARARTLSYDRAGYGGSDRDDRPRTLDRIVDDLTELLDQLGESAPVVLVAHSWGGPIVRVFAARYPGRVAGLVLVDCTVAEVLSWQMVAALRVMFVWNELLLRTGRSGTFRRATLPAGASPEISAADVDILWRDHASVRAMRTGRREARHVWSARQVLQRLQAAGTPDVPTICLQAGQVGRSGELSRTRRIFVATDTRLMAAVPDGKVVVVDGAGHLVPQEAPGPTHDAIMEVLDAARDGRRLTRRPG